MAGGEGQLHLLTSVTGQIQAPAALPTPGKQQKAVWAPKDGLDSFETRILSCPYRHFLVRAFFSSFVLSSLSIMYLYVLCPQVTYSSTTPNTNIYAPGEIRTSNPTTSEVLSPPASSRLLITPCLVPSVPSVLVVQIMVQITTHFNLKSILDKQGTWCAKETKFYPRS
jgi:hypothetical protein